MSIQDAHTHFFSRPFFDALARLSPRKEPPDELLAQVAAKSGLAVPAPDIDAHTDRWLAEMDKHGVERMVSFASLPAEATAVGLAAARSRGRLLAYTLVDPRAADAPAFVERALRDQGFRGLLLFPAMHHVLPDDSRCHALYELAGRHGAPVIVHCGILVVKLRDLLGIPRPYDLSYANPLGIVPAANRFPRVRFVVPHFGGGFFRELLMLGQQCENVLVDSSSSNDWMKTQAAPLDLATVFARTLAVFGAERVLFGTDSSSFPRGYRRDVRDSQLAALAAAGATPAQVERIMGRNLAELLPALQPA